ncbi:hypothetical protein UT300019_02970 [Clostridium sp. CTA-19]
MKLSIQKIIILLINCILGITIMLGPSIITGHFYNVSYLLGGLLISDFIMRTVSFIIGILVIYDSIKRFTTK